MDLGTRFSDEPDVRCRGMWSSSPGPKPASRKGRNDSDLGLEGRLETLLVW